MNFDKYKNIRLFPEIYNIDDFVVDEHPDYIPRSSKHLRYWRKQKKKHIEGLWGYDGKDDEGGYRYMPGPLHFYINGFEILHVDEENNSRTPLSPNLRDVEWMEFYNIFVCQGFSGFEKSDVTCSRLVKKYRQAENNDRNRFGDIIKFSELDKINLEKQKGIYDDNGDLKEYVEPVKYLYNSGFDKPLGKPYYENEVLDYFNLSPRGYGKSYRLACIATHEYLFDGLKNYKVDHQSVGEVFLGTGTQEKTQELANKIVHGLENLPGIYGEGSDYVPSPFAKKTRGSIATKNSNEIEHKYKIKQNGEWVTRGTGSKISKGTFTSTNHTAAASKRRSKIIVDEVGFISNIIDVHGANKHVVKVGSTKYGMNLYSGTGGDMETIEGPKEMFYNPEDFGLYPFEDQWEGTGKTGFFVPATYCDDKFKDDLGNTKLDRAFKYYLNERKELAKGSSPAALINETMYMPLIPSEIFQNKESLLFPKHMLRDREIKIISHNLWDINSSIGDLEYINSDKTAVKWQEDMSETKKANSITKLNMSSYKGSLQGRIVIFEHPLDTPPRNLYKIAYDPYKDEGEGPSLACILVYKSHSSTGFNTGMEDNIVGIYVGRHEKPNDVHEIALQLALYFNTEVLHENNLPGFKNYAELTNRLHLVRPTPWGAISKGQKTVNKKLKYGVSMNESLSRHCEQLSRQWLLSSWMQTQDGEHLRNLDKLYTLRLIREFIDYSRKGNFDAISAFKILMLWISDEKEHTYESEQAMVKDSDDLEDYYNELNKREENSYYAV